MIRLTQASRAAVRSEPYPTKKLKRSILIGPDRRTESRPRKSLSWQPDDQIKQIHYIEYIADERINVTRVNNDQQQRDTNASAATTNQLANGSSQNKLASGVTGLVNPVDRLTGGSGGRQNDEVTQYMPWVLIPMHIVREIPLPGWESKERAIQAEREKYVLGAIDLPGIPSTLEEPDLH